jgi:DNA modification methylase
MVLDPFAGGSVRGLVAARLGRSYVGVDLSARQLEANRAQAATILRPDEPQPRWIEGDSRDLRELAQGTNADFVFACPPYADLERYSDDPRDLSTVDYETFRKALGEIIAKASAFLKPDRFACFVVGDVRDKAGNYYGFPSHVIEAFVAAGLALYNEAILVTAVGSLPIRAAKQFATSRKLGKTHQNVLVFVKGDARAAADAIGEAEFGAISEGDDGDYGEQL